MISGVTFAAALLVSLIAAPAAAAEPALSVTLTDEVTDVSAGDTVEYTASIENTSAQAFEGIATMTAPVFLELESDDATAADGALSWQISIAPGESVEVTASGVVGDDTGDEYQLVVLASIAAADTPADVIARAADADRIAGTEAPPTVQGMQEPDAGSPWPLVLTIGAGLALIAAVLVVVLRVRRRP